MNLHVLLEVEVGEFGVVADLKEARELGIRDDLALVLRVLEGVRLDVLGEKTSDFRACHFGSFGLAEEGAEFRRDARGLRETAGGTLGVRVALLLAALLASVLEGAGPLLVNLLERRVEGADGLGKRRRLFEDGVPRVFPFGSRVRLDSRGRFNSRSSDSNDRGNVGSNSGVLLDSRLLLRDAADNALDSLLYGFLCGRHVCCMFVLLTQRLFFKYLRLKTPCLGIEIEKKRSAFGNKRFFIVPFLFLVF